MRAAHGIIRFRQLAQQPLHFCLLQRHIDLDGRMARDARCDAGANLIEVQRLLLTLELLQDLMQQVLYIACDYPCSCGLHRDRARPKGLHLEPVAIQFLGDFGEDRHLPGSQFDN